MTRWKSILLALTVVSLCSPLAVHAASLGLYDDFSGNKIDAAKWSNLEFVREIRDGKLVQKYRVARTPGATHNWIRLSNPTAVQSMQANVRMNDYARPVSGTARVGLRGAYYNDGTGGPGDAGDVWARVRYKAGASGIVIEYVVIRCVTSDCSTSTDVIPATTVKTVAVGETHTLGIAWDGSVFTFTVDGDSFSVDPKPIVPIGNAAPSTPLRALETGLAFGPAGGEGYAAGDFDDLLVNGTLYDDFAGPLLDPTKWTDLESVRENQNGKLVMKVAGTEAASTFASEVRFVNQEMITAASADVTVTAFQSPNSEVNARALNGAFYNDGSSTGLSDFTGTIAASIRLRSINNGSLEARFLVTRCSDAPCSSESTVQGDNFATVNLNETYTLFLIWDGSIFTYGIQNLGITKTFDPKPVASPVKPAPNHSKLMRTRAEFYRGGPAYGYIAATYDNIYVNSEAVTPSRLAPAFTQAVTGGVVSAGVGLRGTGTGTINLTGLPSGATVQKAFLYWATLGSSGTFTAPTLNGTAVSGALIGQSDDPNWGTAQAFAYRADVTPLVSGNGAYVIVGLPVGPLPPASYAVNDSEGASLVVVYSEPGAPARVITINDGAVTLMGSRVQAYATTLRGFVAANPPTGAALTFVMGDGQATTAEYAGLNATLLAPNEFSGSDGNYWDTRTYDVSTALPAGATRANAIVTTGNDSLVWVAAILSVPGRLHTDAVGVFRPSDGTFYLDYNASGQWDGCESDRCLSIGMNGDVPLVGDWNGSGTSKVGAFRPTDGTFYLDYNGNGTWDGCGTDRCLQIGMLGDIPLVGDWNGSGTSKVGAFRPSDGTFYLDYNGSGEWEGCGTDRCLPIGLNGDKPLVGDWNWSGMSRVGVFRPSDGTFYLDYNGNGQWDGCGSDRCLQIGMLGDIPLVGDWNGSGTSKVGAFRPSDGTFYLDYNGSGTWDGCGTDRCLQIGMNGDIPLVGDWNGSGTTKVGAFRPSDGTFYLDYNGSGTWEGCAADRCLQIGMLNDIPLVGDWNGNGTSKVGAFRPSDGTFYLDYNGSGTWEGCGTDRCLQIGMLNDTPLVGDWNGSGTAKVGVFRPSDGTFYLDYDGSGIWSGCGTDRCLQIGMSGDAPLVGKW